MQQYSSLQLLLLLSTFNNTTTMIQLFTTFAFAFNFPTTRASTFCFCSTFALDFCFGSLPFRHCILSRLTSPHFPHSLSHLVSLTLHFSQPSSIAFLILVHFFSSHSIPPLIEIQTSRSMYNVSFSFCFLLLLSLTSTWLREVTHRLLYFEVC